MNLKNSLVSGTIILTLSGLLSRVIGFFYRIYLSQHFGEEGMGIYQLTGPILGLTYALCISGIQSAIAKQNDCKYPGRFDLNFSTSTSGFDPSLLKLVI